VKRISYFVLHEKHCEGCGKPFTTSNAKARFHDSRCERIHRPKKEAKTKSALWTDLLRAT